MERHQYMPELANYKPVLMSKAVIMAQLALASLALEVSGFLLDRCFISTCQRAQASFM